MPRRCQLTGSKVRSGQNVSHSNRKSKRTFEPNLQRVHLMSDALGRQVAVRVSTRALRSVTKVGGLDAFLLKTEDALLPPEGLALKRDVQRALR
ncbi:MAG TPA: 50S ribosomal protein L28 [Myxococcota bacterium]|jgi:large subunit ribosomal protein L28